MRLLVCLVLPLAVWCAPAIPHDDVIAVDSLKPLIRTKRADEEIVFGNHQNNGEVVKKSDPSLMANEEAVLDKKATMTANTIFDDVVPQSDDEDRNEAGEEPDLEGDTQEDQTGDFAEEGGEGEAEGPFDEGGDPQQQEEEEQDQEQENGGGEEEAENENGKDWYPYEYYDYYPQYPQNMLHSRNPQRVEQVKKRSIADAKPLTAENMDNSPVVSETGSRVKRDLTADDITSWLETGVDPRDSYYGDYDDSWKDKAAIENLLDTQYPDYTEGGGENYIEDYPEYNGMESEDLSGSDDSADNLLSLLEYLVESEETPEVAYDPMSAADDLYPGDVQEEWQDVDFDMPDVYEPIVYNGVPGIFIPYGQAPAAPTIEKRQYLSMMPGMKKRSDFYPYNTEPEGGRWGAFVDGEQEKRDAAEAYNRLYRMAEALNQPQDIYK